MDIGAKAGVRSRALRREKDFTRAVHGFKAGTDTNYVNEVEKGRQNSSVVRFKKIDEASGKAQQELSADAGLFRKTGDAA